MSDVETIMKDAQEQQFVFVHLGFPMAVFKAVNEIAFKEGKTFQAFIAEMLHKKVEESKIKEQKGDSK